MVLVRKIVPFNMEHYAEPDAVDLLVEVEQLPPMLVVTVVLVVVRQVVLTMI